MLSRPLMHQDVQPYLLKKKHRLKRRRSKQKQQPKLKKKRDRLRLQQKLSKKGNRLRLRQKLRKKGNRLRLKRKLRLRKRHRRANGGVISRFLTRMAVVKLTLKS